MHKPMTIAVATSSTLILPATRPATVLDWAESTAFDYGDVVKTAAGRIYWCVAAGTTGTTAPSHTAGDAADSGATWRVLNPIRRRLIVANNGAYPIYLGFDYPAVDAAGVRLNGPGGSIDLSGENGMVHQGAVYAIAVGGASAAGVQEA